jgi:predicted Holliday junction resolvase-like endonuclease
MSVALSIIAIAVLLVLIVVSLRLRHETRAAERKEADVRANVGEAQREGSMRRRADVRAAAVDRTEPIAPHTDE